MYPVSSRLLNSVLYCWVALVLSKKFIIVDLAFVFLFINIFPLLGCLPCWGLRGVAILVSGLGLGNQK